MKLIVESNYDMVSKKAAEIVDEYVKSNPKIILGLATGSTPIGMYKELINKHKTEGTDYSNVRTFNLDEYVGLSGEHPSSYRYFMNEEFFNGININHKNTTVPNGKAENLSEYCKNYDEMIDDAGGIDLQILGVGENGHIAFIEPAHELQVLTSIVTLSESTIAVNSRFFNNIDEVPKTAISMGVRSILKAKKIILLATGEKKKSVVKRLIETPLLCTDFPVSILLCHPDFTLIVDREAYVD